LIDFNDAKLDLKLNLNFQRLYIIISLRLCLPASGVAALREVFIGQVLI